MEMARDDPVRELSTLANQERGMAARPFGSGRLIDVVYPRGLRFPRHDHQHNYLCVTVEGAIRQRYAGADQDLGPGSLCFYASGEAHQGAYGPAGARVFHLELPDDAGDLWPRGRQEQPRITGQARGLAAQIRTALHHQQPFEWLEVEALSAELLLSVAGTAPPPLGPRWIANARDYLRANLSCSVGLTELASAFDLHPSHVAREFRRSTGTTIGTWLRRVRCAEAARLLEMTELPIADVAAHCGFADQSHLGRSFKSVTGTTPSRYRQST